jgi:hypothetical protein
MRAETTRSSYMWTPAVQISNTTHGCLPNVAPAWSTTGSRRIHHVLRECVRPNCNGDHAIGWYIEVGSDLDSAAWVEAWNERDLLTGVQSPSGDSLRGQDFDMVVDRNDEVHVAFEVFHHQAFGDSSAYPAIGYKVKDRPSWAPDTAVVLSDTLTAGITHCFRRDHGPKLFLERGGDADTIHVAIPHDTDSSFCTTPEHWMVYTKKAVDTPDTGSAWPKETFATQGYAKHLSVGGIEMKGAGVRSVLRDSDGRVHMWGKQVFEVNPGDDTVLWRHFWGTPGQLGEAWQDTTSRVLLTDHQPDDFQGFVESVGCPRRRRQLEMYMASSLVEYAHLKDGSLTVKFKGQSFEHHSFQRTTLRGGERPPTRVEFHQGLVDEFNAKIGAGGLVVFGHGYLILVPKDRAKEEMDLVRSLAASGSLDAEALARSSVMNDAVRADITHAARSAE